LQSNRAEAQEKTRKKRKKEKNSPENHCNASNGSNRFRSLLRCRDFSPHFNTDSRNSGSISTISTISRAFLDPASKRASEEDKRISP
jgi:hypothetical protein